MLSFIEGLVTFYIYIKARQMCFPYNLWIMLSVSLSAHSSVKYVAGEIRFASPGRKTTNSCCLERPILSVKVSIDFFEPIAL